MFQSPCDFCMQGVEDVKDIGYFMDTRIFPVDIPLEIFLFQTILCLSIHDHDSHHCDSVLEASDTESLAEVLIELSLLIGTDATTPFIQERCHWGRWHLRVNYTQFSIYKGRFYQIWVELGKATPNSLGWVVLLLLSSVFFYTLDWDGRLMKSPFSFDKIDDLFIV